jgi:hypothetical protein
MPDTRYRIIELFDVSGRQVRNWRMQGQKLQVDISDLPNGIYTLKIGGNASFYGVKLVKR